MNFKDTFKDMPTEELRKLVIEINNIIKERESKEIGNDVLITLRDEFNKVANDEITRYNGGWTKLVVGFDKTKTNGYSLLGNFVKGDTKKNYWKKGSVFVDCDIQGSRKHPHKIYRLFYLNHNGEMELIATDETPDYAVNFWDKIEELLFKEAV